MTVRSAGSRIAIFLAVAGGIQMASAAGGGSPVTPDRYRVLVERNIFLKDRASGNARRGGAPSGVPTVVPPERSIVLTGVVRHGSEYVAFFEDRRFGTTMRLRVGDALLDGRIEQATLDYVEYARNGHTVKVEVGKNLENSSPVTGGGAAVSILRPVQPAPATGGTVSAAPDATDEKGVLEMLRRRRASESGGT